MYIFSRESTLIVVAQILLLADLASSFISHFMIVMKYTADFIKYLGATSIPTIVNWIRYTIMFSADYRF